MFKPKWWYEYLDLRWEKHKKKWDTVGCIVGDEGGSKTNLGLLTVDYWQTKRNGECKKEDIKHICMTGKDFVDDLGDCEKREITCFDEAGELDSRRAMSKFNVVLTQALKVIRADELFVLFILPEFWDLETRFRNRRIKFLVHIYKRGHAAVWLRDKIRKINAINSDRKFKSLYVVKPDFYFTFPEYDGVMKEKYDKMKEKKTKEARQKMKDLIYGKKKKTKEGITIRDVPEHLHKKIAYKYLKENHSKDVALEFVDITKRTSFNYDKEMKNEK